MVVICVDNIDTNYLKTKQVKMFRFRFRGRQEKLRDIESIFRYI